MFHIGQKVVCVNATPFDPAQRLFVPKWPVLNKVYTIRGVKRNGAVVLEEIVNPVIPIFGNEEPHFHRKRFRPVQERSTGMEILRGILTDPQGPLPDAPDEPVREEEKVGEDA